MLFKYEVGDFDDDLRIIFHTCISPEKRGGATLKYLCLLFTRAAYLSNFSMR